MQSKEVDTINSIGTQIEDEEDDSQDEIVSNQNREETKLDLAPTMNDNSPL